MGGADTVDLGKAYKVLVNELDCGSSLPSSVTCDHPLYISWAAQCSRGGWGYFSSTSFTRNYGGKRAASEFVVLTQPNPGAIYGSGVWLRANFLFFVIHTKNGVEK